MNVLVTGGAGYIGSVLVRLLLEQGYKIGVIDRFFFGEQSLEDIKDQIKIYKDDIRYCESKILEGYDAVIDMAAISNDPAGELDQSKTYDINYLGRKRIAELSKKHNVKKYVLASSCSVYGFQESKLDENSPTNPLTTYAKANLEAEKATLKLADKSFCVTVLRQATVYGYSPRMRFDLAVNGMVRGFFINKKIPIMRDGKQWRPFVHIKDTAFAFIRALEADNELINGHIFNVGSNDQNIQIFDLAKIIAEAIRVDFLYEWYGSPDNRSYMVDFSKIERVLKFKTKYTFEDGAKEIYKLLEERKLDPFDIKTMTLNWYKHLYEMDEFLKNIKINNKIL